MNGVDISVIESSTPFFVVVTFIFGGIIAFFAIMWILGVVFGLEDRSNFVAFCTDFTVIFVPIALAGGFVSLVVGLVQMFSQDAQNAQERVALIEDHYDVSILDANSVQLPMVENATSEVTFYTDGDTTSQYSGTFVNTDGEHVVLLVTEEGASGTEQVEWGTEEALQE